VKTVLITVIYVGVLVVKKRRFGLGISPLARVLAVVAPEMRKGGKGQESPLVIDSFAPIRTMPNPEN
jgi:hypothetical protein